MLYLLIQLVLLYIIVTSRVPVEGKSLVCVCDLYEIYRIIIFSLYWNGQLVWTAALGL